MAAGQGWEGDEIRPKITENRQSSRTMAKECAQRAKNVYNSRSLSEMSKERQQRPKNICNVQRTSGTYSQNFPQFFVLVSLDEEYQFWQKYFRPRKVWE